jgi:hypothetical protein
VLCAAFLAASCAFSVSLGVELLKPLAVAHETAYAMRLQERHHDDLLDLERAHTVRPSLHARLHFNRNHFTVRAEAYEVGPAAFRWPPSVALCKFLEITLRQIATNKRHVKAAFLIGFRCAPIRSSALDCEPCPAVLRASADARGLISFRGRFPACADVRGGDGAEMEKAAG